MVTWPTVGWQGKGEAAALAVTNQKEPRSKLRYAEIRGIEDSPTKAIGRALARIYVFNQTAEKEHALFLSAVVDAMDVFKYECLG